MIELIVGAIIVAAIIWFVMFRGTLIEMHQYQKDFLDTMVQKGTEGATNSATALAVIVQLAQKSSKVHGEIFDGFHCIHCGSVKPADWIANRKGKKEPQRL